MATYHEIQDMLKSSMVLYRILAGLPKLKNSAIFPMKEKRLTVFGKKEKKVIVAHKKCIKEALEYFKMISS
jgi:hypothetical protein